MILTYFNALYDEDQVGFFQKAVQHMNSARFMS